MLKPNKRYQDLKDTYLFNTIYRKTNEYLEKNPGKIDYIHEADVVKELASKDNAVGFLLPGIEKNQFFKGIVMDGVLPRKTFSMGHAQEKRYYLEARKIV